MDERLRFVVSARSGHFTIAALCRRYGVSRKTGYKWLARYEADGRAGLRERSRAPRRRPQALSMEMVAALMETRRLYPSWGPRKLAAWLQRRMPDVRWPAPSTIGDVFRRQGVPLATRRPRRRSLHPGRPHVVATAPNHVWTADFKGQFRLRNGVEWCVPLTVADLHSRYLLAVRAMHTTDAHAVQDDFTRLFREVGLPRVILTDNGPPFASTGLLGLTTLSVWWIRLGIHPLRIEPSRPDQNGAHERMHRTLKAETTWPRAGNRVAQQRRFNHFRQVYNLERPHEALDQHTPASRWRPSRRAFPERLPLPDYPSHFEERIVSDTGMIALHSTPIRLTSALRGERVGLEETDDGVWSVHFCHVLLGRLDQRTYTLYT